MLTYSRSVTGIHFATEVSRSLIVMCIWFEVTPQVSSSEEDVFEFTVKTENTSRLKRAITSQGALAIKSVRKAVNSRIEQLELSRQEVERTTLDDDMPDALDRWEQANGEEMEELNAVIGIVYEPK